MIRTQIYLTEKEQKLLFSLAHDTGKKKSEIIREALDEYLEKYSQKDRMIKLKKAKGLWKNREDLPDFSKLRKEFDRE